MNEPGDYLRVLRGVGVFQWDPARGTDDLGLGLLNNFGDLLGPAVVERMLWLKPSLRPVAKRPQSRLLSVGSVLHMARNGDVVWGSGVNGKILQRRLTRWPRLDLRAVRGPWTARILLNAGLRVPRVFGDPAILVGRLFPELNRWARSKDHDTLVVPNFNDMTQYQDSDYEVMAPTEPLWTVLRAIVRSRFVVGSSLHAIVVADALGVPARFVASGHEDPFKYRDYLAGTGRPTTRIAESVSNALDLGPHRSPYVDLDTLEQAFPWDLWGIETAEDSVPTAEFVADAMQSKWMERIASKNGPHEAVRRFTDELVPQVRQAALDGSPDLESLVSQACDYRVEVAPEVAIERFDDDTQRIVAAIQTRDASLVRLAALLSNSPPLAMLRGVRLTGTHLIISVVLHYPRTLATVRSVELVLTGTLTGRVVREPVAIFDIQRSQWHVDFDVLVDNESLRHDESWTLSVETGEPTPEFLDVFSVPSQSLEMLALERGNLPTSAPRATITKDGSERWLSSLAQPIGAA